MIEQINAELEKQIYAEVKEREQSNNALLNLLEESCYKIENYFTQTI
jgi:hypothetical protein